MVGHLISWRHYPCAIPCHALPCPAIALSCYDTHFSTQTGLAFWPGLISCHSRWSRDQEHYGLLSDSTAPPDTDRTGIMCVWGTMSAHDGVCVLFSLTPWGYFVCSRVKEKRQDGMVKAMSGCSVHILLHIQPEKRPFYCKRRCSVDLCMSVSLEKFNYLSVNFCLRVL